jgi:hypothetical protein
VVGDRCGLEGARGCVREIRWRSSKVRTMPEFSQAQEISGPSGSSDAPQTADVGQKHAIAREMG